MEIAVALLIGVAIGILVGMSYAKKQMLKKYTIGDLRVDRSDEDGPFCFMELYPDCGDFITRDAVMLIVKKEDFISRK